MIEYTGSDYPCTLPAPSEIRLTCSFEEFSNYQVNRRRIRGDHGPRLISDFMTAMRMDATSKRYSAVCSHACG